MIGSDKIQINNRWYNSGTLNQLLSNDAETWMVSLVEFIRTWFSKEDFIEVHTSGSTGEPKIIRLKKESMVNSATMTCQFFNLNEESTALLCLPADYIAGKMMVVRAIVSGLNLIAVKPEADPFRNLDSFIDFAAITPYQFVNAYQSIQETAVKKIIIGGSQVSMRLQKMMEDLHTEFYETYGMTETCSHIALRKLNGNNKSEYFEILDEIKIRTDNRSCLAIKAPSLADQELITNDVVEIKDSAHFKWLGRYDNVINSGGIKIFPEQIEKKLEPYIDGRFFVSSMRDQNLGEKVILVIEDESEKTKETELQNIFEQELNKFEKPKSIYYSPSFLLSSSGKILKTKILEELL